MAVAVGMTQHLSTPLPDNVCLTGGQSGPTQLGSGGSICSFRDLVRNLTTQEGQTIELVSTQTRCQPFPYTLQTQISQQALYHPTFTAQACQTQLNL